MVATLHAKVADEQTPPATAFSNYRIAVLIPCYNEELTIGSVIAKFRRSLPSASIYVYDNNSRDDTCRVAATAGAIVRREPLQGKGEVVRRMFSDIEADIYVLVDGDNTYDASAAPQLIRELINRQIDCVSAVRVANEKEAYRPGHQFGNWMFTKLVGAIFGHRTADLFTGYRVLSRRFVKSFPALASGFEIEAEMTIHALELRVLMADVPTNYAARPPGSASKLSSYRDGLRILRTIAVLIKEERPFQFFGTIAVVLTLVALMIFLPVFMDYLATGLVRRFPTAILSVALTLAAGLSLACGLILDTVTRGRREMKRLNFLHHPVPPYLADAPQAVRIEQRRG